MIEIEQFQQIFRVKTENYREVQRYLVEEDSFREISVRKLEREIGGTKSHFLYI